MTKQIFSLILLFTLVDRADATPGKPKTVDPISVDLISIAQNENPVIRIAATKFGSFFRNLFKRKEKEEEQTVSEKAPALNLKNLKPEEMRGAIKDALGTGLQSAVEKLGAPGGFLTNKAVKLTMPDRLKPIEAGLRKVGQGELVDGFIAGLNTAAEKAVPAASGIFGDYLNKLPVKDAEKLLSGKVDSATQYFRKNTESEITTQLRAKVKAMAAQTGLGDSLTALMSKIKYGASLLDYDVEDLDRYVTSKTLDGVFKLIADEEKQIRLDPARRGTELLQKVFGATQM